MVTKLEAALQYLKERGGIAPFDEVVNYLEASGRWKYIKDDLKYAARHTKSLVLLVKDGVEYIALSDVLRLNKESEQEIEVIEPDYSVFIPQQVPPYVPTNGELEILDVHFEAGVPVLFVGPKGVGKTLSIAHYAYQKGIPLIQFDCSETTKRQDLLGRYVLLDGEVKFMLGVLPQAIQAANKFGAAVLVLEELNALTPQMQKVLNQLLDWRGHVFVPEVSRVYKLKDGAKLLIAATMNPSTYGGVYALNEDLKSRFSQLFIEYPDEKKEQEIVETVVGDEVPSSLVKAIIQLAKETRNGWESGELSYALSPRDVVQFLTLVKVYLDRFDSDTALKYALRTAVVGKYEDKSERETVVRRIQSIFGVIP